MKLQLSSESFNSDTGPSMSEPRDASSLEVHLCFPMAARALYITLGKSLHLSEPALFICKICVTTLVYNLPCLNHDLSLLIMFIHNTQHRDSLCVGNCRIRTEGFLFFPSVYLIIGHFYPIS